MEVQIYRLKRKGVTFYFCRPEIETKSGDGRTGHKKNAVTDLINNSILKIFETN